MKAIATAALLACALTACASMVGDVRTFRDPSIPTPAQVHARMAAQAQARQAYAAPMPVAQPVAMQAGDGGGSIYASAATTGNRGMRLFQDNKAREVGDILTIVLVERTTSTSRAQTAVTKDSSIDMAAPSIAGQSVTVNGRNILQASVEGSRAFAGGGDTKQSNALNGTVTVTVVQDLGNGNLLVSGEKQVRLNQGDEVVQVQGVVRVSDISADNRIASDRVADAKIVYGGRGTIARSNAMGWLGRFFNSAVMPY